MEMLNVDLRKKVRKSFVFPTRGHGLKSVGSFLGFPFRNKGFNGFKVALGYQRHVEEMSQSLSRRYFDYNEDDVRVLPFIEQWATNQNLENGTRAQVVTIEQP
jgi:predicted RecB family nuclease